MKAMKVKIKKVHPLAKLPEFAHQDDAGMDLFSVEEKLLKPFERALIKTGLKLELPENTEAEIRPRSGLALNEGISVLNSPGTIDAGYRGELGIILINLSQKDFLVEKEMKIAQMLIKPIYRPEIIEVSELSKTTRDEGGFGSSGY